MKIFELTAKGRYYKVYRDEEYISQHTTEREAIESAEEVAFAEPFSAVLYRHEYETEVALTTAGLTVAGTVGGQLDLPPVMNSIPAPAFLEGTADTYDMSQHWTDDGKSTVTSSLINPLPNGLSYNGSTHILTYDGIGLASISQHVLLAEDAVGSAQGAVFDIEIEEEGTIPTPDIIVRESGGDFSDLPSALLAANPGDLVEMQDDGSPWIYTSAVSISDVHGEEGNEIRVRVAAGHRINMYPSGSPNRVFQMQRCSYLVVEASPGSMYIGDRSLWLPANGGTANYTHEVTFDLTDNCHHNDFEGLHFSGGNAYVAVLIAGNAAGTAPCHHNRLINCSGRNHGWLRAVQGDRGDGMAISGYSNIVENFDAWRFGGHNYLQGSANRLVVRSGRWNGNWDTDEGPGSGYRVWGFQDADTNTFGYDSDVPWGPKLIEGNVTIGGGWTDPPVDFTNPQRSGNARQEVGGRWPIYRYNYAWDSLAEDGMVQEAASDLDRGYILDKSNTHEFLRDYNNTEYNNVGWHHDSGDKDGNLQDHRYRNNIIAEVTAGVQARIGYWSNLNIVSRRNTRSDIITGNLEGWPDSWKGRQYVGNMIDADIFGVELHYYPSGSIPPGELPLPTYIGRETTLANVKAKWPLVWLPSNTEDVATFVDATLRTKDGFALMPGSYGRGTADHITTVEANATSDTITLEDCFWIYDGAGRFDLGYFGEVGDYFAIFDSDGVSNKRVVQALMVNSQTSVTLTGLVTVAVGDKVWPMLPDGITVCKNKGANQS